MLDFRGYNSRPKGLADLLPYAFLVDDGVVLTKDGSLLTAWEFRGRDTASSTEDELTYVSEQVNQALMHFGTGWMMHVDAIRSATTRYPDPASSHFPDRVSRMIDEERRSFFSGALCFETRTILTLAYKPGRGLTQAMLGNQQTLGKVLDRFQTEAANFEATLDGILAMSRLRDYWQEDSCGQRHLFSPLLSHLQECLTGELQPVMVPQETAMFLDGLLGSQDLVGGLEPKLGPNELLVISIDGFPENSWPAILDMLSSLPLAYRFNLRFLFKDQQEALAELEERRKTWAQLTFSFLDKFFENPNARANRDALNMNEDAEEAIAKAQGGELGFGRLTATVVLMHEHRETLDDLARAVQNQLRNQMGFGSRVETYNALDAWRGTLPGEWQCNMRDSLVSTRNLAHLMPLASVWPGAATAPCPFYPPNSPPLMVCTTDGSTPFRFNLHVGDLGHALILGPTGAGKSTFLALICAQFRRYAGAQIFAFDKGLSLFPLCMAVGGAHYDIAGDGESLSFAPLRHLDESDGEFAWACEWLAGLVELQGGAPLTAGEREVIARAAQTLKNNQPGQRTLTHFLGLLSFSPDNRLISALSQFCGDGPLAKYMDDSQDSFEAGTFSVFEIEHLMKMGDHAAVPILLYLFHCVERALKGQPALVVLDEAWVMLGHPVCRAMVREWLKVMRKKNCAVVLATQSLSDATNSKILDVVAESCPTKVFLANPEAANGSQKPLYQLLGLNERQIGIIARGRMKGDYYVEARGVGRRQMQLALDKCPRTLAFVGASGQENLAAIRTLIRRYGAAWPEKWLEAKNL